MPQTRSSTKRKQSRLTFTPIPSSSPVAATGNRAAFVRIEQSLTPSKMSRKPVSSASKHSPTFKLSSPEKKTLPTPAPSSQIGQKDEESSDSTETESEIPVSSRTFGRYARPGTGGSNTPPLTPQSSKASAADPLFPPEANIFDETLKRKTDERKPTFRKLRRRLSFSLSTVSSSADEDCVKPSSSRRNKQATALARAAGSPSNEGSSEDVIVPQRRRRLITRNIPDPHEIDSDSRVSQNQVNDDLQEDLDDLHNSGEFRVEYIMQLIFIFTILILHTKHNNIAEKSFIPSINMLTFFCRHLQASYQRENGEYRKDQQAKTA